MRLHLSSRWLLPATGALIWALGAGTSAQTTPARPTPQRGRPAPAAPPPAGPAAAGSDPREAIAKRLCAMCHPYEFVVAVRHTRAQWEATVENMIGRGARGTPAEFAAVIDYLSENHVLAPNTVRGGSGPDDRPMVDPKASEAAKPLYAADCLACHGADARGTPQGVNLVRSLVVLRDRYGSTLGPYLHAAHPPVETPPKGGSQATPFEGLTSREVLLLAHFLRDRINDTLRGAPMFKPGNVLTGDPKAGADYFNGEGGCAQCHSPAGDLAGIGRRLEPVNLQQRFLFPGGGVRRQGPSAKVVTVTVTTASGETLSGDLDRMDDFNVSFRDSTGAYRTVRRTPGTRVVKNDPFAAHIALLPRLTDKNIHDVVAYLETLK